MKNIFRNKKVLKDCKIYQMLRVHARRRHLSFHTPGHKVGRWDVTELSFSDNLACPRGPIAEAEKEVAETIGAYRSFILTDGSTCGVLAMLHAAKALGIRTVAVCEASHKSVFNGCALLGLTPLLYPQKNANGIPLPYTMYELKVNFKEIFTAADALFFTSPDYYGNVAELTEIRRFCDEMGKLLLIDGAHGSHLHFDKTLYAGGYADMWVDGVHKNLPAFTQGAIVSAREERFATALRSALDIFRTTSPSYPIMASVEYAVKSPRNTKLEKEATELEKSFDRIFFGGDWTKLCAVFGDKAFEAEKEFEKQGVYAEFCDGNIVMFYLSPATSKKEFRTLKKLLSAAFEKYPIGPLKTEKDTTQRNPAPLVLPENGETEWVEIGEAAGRICAANCGLFPPCVPLIGKGEQVTEEKIRLLNSADNVFGLIENKILVYNNEREA